jgi:hypothetical protein
LPDLAPFQVAALAAEVVATEEKIVLAKEMGRQR